LDRSTAASRQAQVVLIQCDHYVCAVLPDSISAYGALLLSPAWSKLGDVLLFFSASYSYHLRFSISFFLLALPFLCLVDEHIKRNKNEPI